MGPEDAIDGIKAKHWAIFLGRSPMYYLMQFFRMSETRRRITFSFSAFFFGPAYLLYRKMWREGILTGILSVLFYLPGLLDVVAYYNPGFFGSLPVGWLPAAATLGEIANWALRVVLALFAVSWYEKHAKNRIETVCSRCPRGRSAPRSFPAAAAPTCWRLSCTSRWWAWWRLPSFIWQAPR